MVGENPQPRTDRKTASDIAIDSAHSRHDSMLLVGFADYVVAEDRPVFGAHLTEAEVALLFLGSAIPAHRHPSCVDDRPAFFLLVADDRREYAQRNVVGGAHTHVVH